MKTIRKIILGLLISTSLWAARYRPEVLPEVIDRVEKSSDRPVVVFDIDDTLTSTRDRHLRVLKKFVTFETIRETFPDEVEAVDELKANKMHYELEDSLHAAGIHTDPFINLAKAYWTTNFYGNDFPRYDRIIHGAVDYVNEVYSAGAIIVYLTGRDEPRMGIGTRENLRLRGFPLGGRAKLMMKPTKEVPDLDFKKGAFDAIARLGSVVAVFENEPANINAMVARFPDARAVFIDSIHSKRPDVPVPSVEWVKDYLPR